VLSLPQTQVIVPAARPLFVSVLTHPVTLPRRNRRRPARPSVPRIGHQNGQSLAKSWCIIVMARAISVICWR
jgi:hypothetical protein